MDDYLGPVQTHSELLEVLDLWNRAFPATSRSYFEYALLYDPAVEYEHIRILRSQGQVVSSVLVTSRQLYLNGKAVPFGGIANVSTHPLFAKRGFSTRVLQDSLTAMRSWNLPLSMLFTSINPFYERVGFVTLQRKTFSAHFGTQAKPDPSVRIFDLQRDLEAVKAIHSEFSRCWNGPMVRDDQYWRSHFFLKKQNTKYFLVRFEKGSPVAYLRGKEGSDAAIIMEFGAVKNEAENLLALSQELLLRSNRQTVQITAPIGKYFEACGTCTVTEKPNTEIMLAILDAGYFGGTGKIEALFPLEKTLYWETDSF